MARPGGRRTGRVGPCSLRADRPPEGETRQSGRGGGVMSSTITSISDVRRFFCRNQRPIYYISATNFNLQGMDEWVANFRSICHIDCFDGRHPNVFVPRERAHDQFQSIEDVNNYLLRHPDVVDFIRVRGDRAARPPARVPDVRRARPRSSATTSGWRSGSRRPSCGSAATTRSRRCASARRPACPACPTRWRKVQSYQKLRAVAQQAGLGKDLVVQTRLRRQRPHHLLHLLQEGLGRARRGDRRRARGQGHEAHRAAAGDPGGVRHALRHRRRSAAHRDGRACPS